MKTNHPTGLLKIATMGVLLAAAVGGGAAEPVKLCATPPMGWNSFDS
jgi:hypothetical protein